jgi:hypothetical protein
MRRQPRRRRSRAAALRCQLFSFCWIWCVCLALIELDVNCIRCINSVYIDMLLDVWTLCYIYVMNFWFAAWMQNVFWTINWMLMGEVMSACPSLLCLLVATGIMTSAPPSLIGATVVMGAFYLSLLCHHCSNTLVAMGQLSIGTVTYGPLLQCLLVVVKLCYSFATATEIFFLLEQSVVRR